MTSVVDAVIVNAGARRSDLQAGRTKDEIDMAGGSRWIAYPSAYGEKGGEFR
jgi:hypothetical protein